MPSHFVIIRNIHHQNTSTYSHSIIYETKKENITHELFSKIKKKKPHVELKVVSYSQIIIQESSLNIICYKAILFVPV